MNMREKLNLNATGPERIKHILIFGAYGAGKTHLQGDFLRYYKEQGRKCRFLNITGEDGFQSLKNFDLGEIGETVENLGDYSSALADYHKEGNEVLAVDSLTRIHRLMLIDVVGELRYPDAAKDRGQTQPMWGRINMGLEREVFKSRSAAQYTLWVAPYDRGTNPVEGGDNSLITPNLPGQKAFECYGWFDMVGYLSTRQGSGPGKVIRQVSFIDDGRVQTRSRLPRPITEPILIPEGGGGWKSIRTAIEHAFKGGK